MTELADRLGALDDDALTGVLIEVATARGVGTVSLGDDLAGILGVGRVADGVVGALTGATPRVITSAELSGEDEPGSVVDDVLQQLRIEAAVRRRLLSEVEFLDAAAVARLLQREGANPRDVASGLRRRSQLLGVDVGGRALFPAFQLDALRARVRPLVRDVNIRLGASSDSWGVLSWWWTPSTRRSDRARPADLVDAGEAQAVHDLAEAVVSD